MMISLRRAQASSPAPCARAIGGMGGIGGVNSRSHRSPRLAASASSAAATSPSVVVFAIDDTEAAAQALEWTAAALCKGAAGANASSTTTKNKKKDLRLLHVVCDARAAATSIGVTPTGRVRRDAAELADRRSPAVREHEARLVAAAREMVERRCRAAGVAVSGGGGGGGDDDDGIMLPVAPGAKSAAMIGAAVCRAARSVGPGAALVVPSHGPGALADFGSVARFCYQKALAASSGAGGSTRAAGDCSALVLVPPASAREAARSRRVALAPRSAEELDTLVAWAVENVVLAGDEVLVIPAVAGAAAAAAAGSSTSSSFELSAGARKALEAANVGKAEVVDATKAAGEQQQLWQQAVLDAAAGSRALLMLEDEHPASSGEADTFEGKMAALMGGGGSIMTWDDGDVATAGAWAQAEQAATGLADFASRRASVPLVLVKREVGRRH